MEALDAARSDEAGEANALGDINHSSIQISKLRVPHASVINHGMSSSEPTLFPFDRKNTAGARRVLVVCSLLYMIRSGLCGVVGRRGSSGVRCYPILPHPVIETTCSCDRHHHTALRTCCHSAFLSFGKVNRKFHQIMQRFQLTNAAVAFRMVIDALAVDGHLLRSKFRRPPLLKTPRDSCALWVSSTCLESLLSASGLPLLRGLESLYVMFLGTPIAG